MEISDTFSLPGWPLWITFAAVVPVLYGIWHWMTVRPVKSTPVTATENTQPSKLGSKLANSLPGSVFFHHHQDFKTSQESYWSKQNRDITPECIIKPHNTQEVSTAIKILKEEYEYCMRNATPRPTFGVRSGGHSTIPGASTASGGIVIDLSLFKQVELAEDHASVVVGSGVRWGEVSRKLDPFGLAVVGGRNSDVGVGGLTLGGEFTADKRCWQCSC